MLSPCHNSPSHIMKAVKPTCTSTKHLEAHGNGVTQVENTTGLPTFEHRNRVGGRDCSAEGKGRKHLYGGRGLDLLGSEPRRRQTERQCRRKEGRKEKIEGKQAGAGAGHREDGIESGSGGLNQASLLSSLSLPPKWSRRVRGHLSPVSAVTDNRESTDPLSSLSLSLLSRGRRLVNTQGQFAPRVLRRRDYKCDW